MTAAHERIALTAALTALVALAALSATTLGAAARRMPLVVAIPTLVLLAFELTRQVRAPHPRTRTSRNVARKLRRWPGSADLFCRYGSWACWLGCRFSW